MRYPVAVLLSLLIAGVVWAQEFRTDARISQIRPKKPVRIELRRDTEGRYSWSLRGSDLEEILRIDQRLRHYLLKQRQ
jgi:hypothetical protein